MTFKAFRDHYARERKERLGRLASLFVTGAVMAFVLWFVTQCHQIVLAQ